MGLMYNELDALDTMKVSYSVLLVEYGKLSKENSELKTKITSLSSRVDGLKSDVSNLEIENEGKNSRIIELTKDCRRYKKQRWYFGLAGLIPASAIHYDWKYGNR
jgi:chromosome segregation ATPase